MVDLVPSRRMNSLNESLFAALNAHAGADATVTGAAIFFAEYAIWLVPMVLLACWLWGGADSRRAAVETALAGFLALGLAQVIALSMYHPRPFAIGLGRQLMAHAPDSSFPSDHATLVAAVAATFLLHASTRVLGIAFSLLWLPIAWSRIYLGVHFPADMLGGLLVGCGATGAVRWLGDSIATAAQEALEGVYQVILGPLIRRGWVRP